MPRARRHLSTSALLLGVLVFLTRTAVAADEVAPTTPSTETAVAPHEASSTGPSIGDTRRLGLLFGLVQLLAGGGNVQIEGAIGRFAFDYSHGFSLEIPTTGDDKDQGLALHVPHSIGIGLGYRFTESLDLRFEPKLHQFRASYSAGPREGERVASYNTVTLGLGAYYSWRPFKTGPAEGITITPSVRFWPNVWSSLDDDRQDYDNVITGRREVHRASNIGLGQTPVLANVSVGYVFSL